MKFWNYLIYNLKTIIYILFKIVFKWCYKNKNFNKIYYKNVFNMNIWIFFIISIYKFKINYFSKF